MAKRFFYVCAGIFLLALSYHLGYRNADAQQGGFFVGVAGYFASNSQTADVVAITQYGDTYRKQGSGSWIYIGNPTANPIQAEPTSVGAVKDRYRR